MPFVFKRLALFMSIAACFAADKPAAFQAPAVVSQPHHQTSEKVTIGADPYVEGDKVKTAFGKLVPNNYGVLPVLVVIQNDSAEAIRLDHIKAAYVAPNGDRIDATPAKDVRYARGPNQPKIVTGPAG